MSKFCGNCGTMLPDDARVCGNCGTVLTQPAAPAPTYAPEQTPTYAPQAPVQPEAAPAENVVSAVKDKTNAFVGKMKSDKKFMMMVIAIAGGAVTLLAVLIILLCVLGGGYEKAISNKIDAQLGDYDAYIDCYPEAYWDDHDMLDEDELEDLYDFIDNDDYDIDLDFEVIDEDEITGSSFTTLKSRVHDRWGVSKQDISEAYSLSVLYSSEIDDEDYYELEEVTVVKIDGDWYVFD